MKIGWLGEKLGQGTALLDRIISIFWVSKTGPGFLFSVQTSFFPVFSSPGVDRRMNDDRRQVITIAHPESCVIVNPAHSSHKQSEIEMHFQIGLSPLLNVQRMVWLGLPLW